MSRATELLKKYPINEDPSIKVGLKVVAREKILSYQIFNGDKFTVKEVDGIKNVVLQGDPHNQGDDSSGEITMNFGDFETWLNVGTFKEI